MSTSAEKSSKPATTATRAPGEVFFAKSRGGGFFPSISRASTTTVQNKPTVSKPGDALEKEADSAADHVMRTSAAGPPVTVATARRDNLSRAAIGSPAVSGDAQAAIHNAATGGQPLPADVRGFVEPRLGADFGQVRIHTDGEAATLNNHLSARAFTHRNHIFFARDEYQPGSSDGRRLLAHELTHTIQQGHSAQSGAVQRSPKVTTTASPPPVQRLGVQDALDYFADKAYYIPGFRMLTLVLGFNPIDMRSADRTAANLLRALIELVPGGAVITQVLDNHGVINKAAAWVEQKIATLGDIGGQIVGGLKRFIDSLGWRDIFSLGDVWDRAKRIFTDPIGRLISFGASVVTELLQMVKEAILRPLAALAEGTRGYDLLKATLGQDPITGEPVPRNADTLIGGFMKLIGQEEVWANLKKGNAVARAWNWFQQALTGLMGFVRAVPRTIIDTLRSLTFQDVITVVGAFRKVVGAFVNIATDFISWGVKQVLSLLEILVSVVAPGVMPYIAKAKAAFQTIVKDPVRFVGNLVRAGRLGFQMFANNIVEHLKNALIKWITGPLGEAGVYIPTSFTLIEIVKLVLSVLGLTWQNIRTKLLKIIPEPVLTALEKTAKILVTLVTEGPAAAWQEIKTELTELKDQLIGQVTQMITSEVVKAAVVKLVSMLNPAGAVIQAIIATYNTVTFFIQKINQIASVVASFIDSIAAIATGQVEGAAKKVEQTMANTLTVIIAFLAKFVGLGNVPEKLVGIIKKIRQPIDKGLDRIVGWLGKMLEKLKGATDSPAPGDELREPLTIAGKEHEITSVKGGFALQIASNHPEPLAEKKVPDLAQAYAEYLAAVNKATSPSARKAIAKAEVKKLIALLVSKSNPEAPAPGIGIVAPHGSQLSRLRDVGVPLWYMRSEHVIPRFYVDVLFAAHGWPKVTNAEYTAMTTVMIYKGAEVFKDETTVDIPTGGDFSLIAQIRTKLATKTGLAATAKAFGRAFRLLTRGAIMRTVKAVLLENTRNGEARGPKGEPESPTPATDRIVEAANRQQVQIDAMTDERTKADVADLVAAPPSGPATTQ